MKRVAICYGAGGHKEQAKRLCNLLLEHSQEIIFYSITDVGNSLNFTENHIQLGEFRDKYNGNLMPLKQIYMNFKRVKEFILDNNIQSVISTGPGLSVLLFFVCKLYKVNFFHFETWSRFEKLSSTTKLLNILGCRIFYQNIELKKFLPKGIYVGRL